MLCIIGTEKTGGRCHKRDCSEECMRSQSTSETRACLDLHKNTCLILQIVYVMYFLFQPLFGLIQAKLQLITHAYFEEKDFSQISILKVRSFIHSICIYIKNKLQKCV